MPKITSINHTAKKITHSTIFTLLHLASIYGTFHYCQFALRTEFTHSSY